MDPIFEKMAATIFAKRGWHEDRRRLYDGDHRASMVKITKDPKVNAYVKAALEWPRIAVDHLISDCIFDAFENDSFGVTRVLVESGGDQAIMAAETNAAIGAVSFIAIIPRDDDLPILVPFSGAEATGVKTARGDELSYGLAVKKRKNGLVEEWYFFERGAIHVLNAQGEVIDSVSLGVDAMPFIQFTYDPDPSQRPFGRSRLSSASINILNQGLRNIGLSEQISLINLLKGDLLLVQGTPEGVQSEEYQASVSTLKALYFDGMDLNGVKLEQLQQIELAQVEKAISRAATQYAASMSMSPTMFGEQPSNGSFSKGTLQEMQKPYNHTKNKTRASFAASIRLLAIELYKIVAQTDDVDGIMGIEAVFKEEFKVDKIGAIGDAFQKLTSSLEALGQDIEIPQSMVREIIGVPLRPSVMEQPLPNFEASRDRFREISIDGF